MQITVRNVQQRGGSLCYRRCIPDDVRHHYDGIQEYYRSLKTKDLLLAQSWAILLNRLFKSQFKEHRAGRKAGDTRQADELLEVLVRVSEIGMPQTKRKKTKARRSRVEIPRPRIEDCTGPLLSEVLEELTAARPCKYRSQLGRNSSVRLLIDWWGDLPVDAYTWKMMIDFRDNGLMQLPPNVYKPSNEGQNARVLAMRKHNRTMSPNTVNNKLNRLSTVFNFAKNHGYIAFTPTRDLKLRLDRISSRERDCYSRDQLQRMVDNLADLTQRVTKDRRSLAHQFFWVTLICLYSGARLNEIAQLLVSDIVKVDGIPCISISEEGGQRKSLKNSNSWRVIPIHPVLIELGFMRFHQERLYWVGNPETANLWPKASRDWHGDGNWGRKVSRWFAGVLRPRFLTEGELEDVRARRKSYCFHSLRHTFISFAQNQARMLPRIEMRMTGHADPFISEIHARYGKDLHPSVMLEELVKLDYGLDLSSLMGRY